MKLPEFLSRKEALVNMKFRNENKSDNQCFKWCVARALNPVERNSGRVTQILRKQSESLNFTGIEFPVSLKAIDKFERLNPKIAVSVLGYENNIYSLRISKFRRENNVTHLLENKHFFLVKSLSRLCSSQSSKDTRKKEYCLRCLNHFPSKNALEQHEEYCDNYDVKLTLPEKGVVAAFKNHKHSMKVPIVVYADIESFTRPIDTCNPYPEKSFTKKYQKHEPSGICFFVKCLGKFSQPVFFHKNERRRKCFKHFCGEA